jgi:hypothetical protein
MNAVRHFCDNAIVLESGRIAFHGAVDDAIEFYLKQSEERKAKAEPISKRVSPFFGDLFENPSKISVTRHEWLVSAPIRTHEKIRFEFDFELNSPVRQLIIGIPIWNVDDRSLVTSILSDFAGVQVPVKDGRCRGFIEIDCHLNPGTYLSSFNVRDGVEYLYRQLNQDFVVSDSRRSFGSFSHDARWQFE